MTILEDQCCQGYFSVLIVSQSEMSAFIPALIQSQNTPFSGFPYVHGSSDFFSTIEKKTVPRMKIDFPSL